MFEQSQWLKPYIDCNAEKEISDNFEKDLFKLMDTSAYSKTLENLTNRADVRIVRNAKDYQKLVSKPSFVSQKIFNKTLTIVDKIKKVPSFNNNPAYIGMCILDLSKNLMFDFRYIYIKEKPGNKDKLLSTETDSLV